MKNDKNENNEIYGHDLTNPEPFKKLNIPPPAKLETDEDFTTLFHYFISKYHRVINAYSNRFGYGDRQRLLVYIMEFLTKIMPAELPQDVENYPDSLQRIDDTIGQLIIMSMDYTGLHPEED